MNKPVLAGILALAVTVILGGIALAQSAQVQSLRGADVDDPVVLDQVHRLQQGRLQRNYRQQPPLIPHKIEQYQIDIRTNQCLSCHDWTKAGERGAPTLSMTHYLDRDGNELDHIAGTRYFCNQCHVPQADAPALVENVFEPSSPAVR
ncbi:MAG: nitrate reductase cytochrome c-type subunit [Rhodobacteraceae bacterium]|nr:nitrate reductase cytochrome c-type subunit [Paracoccaceae bacterium]